MKKLLLAAVVVGFAFTSGCSVPAEPAANESVEDLTPVAEASEPVEIDEPEEPRITLPDGYPHIVEVSELPTHMQDAFARAGTGQAVAVAEGVWADLPPGATAEDAVSAMVFSGFCASKEAFERDYLAGNSTAGTCW